MKKMMMFAVVCAMVLGLGAVNALASPLDLASDRYLGTWTPSEPAGDDDELAYLNYLLDMNSPSGPTSALDRTFTRSNKSCGSVPCVDATLVGSFRDESESNIVDLGTGFTYLVGKYGRTTHVWYVAGLTGTLTGADSIPQSLGTGLGLSHWTRYNPTTVPDGGTTLMLLGGALLGLESLRRRFRA